MDLNGQEVILEEINLKEMLDRKIIKRFSFQGTIVEVSLIWVNSKVNYYNKEITKVEGEVNMQKEGINILNNCITHIEGK